MNNTSRFNKYKEKAEEVLQDSARVQGLLGTALEKLKSILESNEKLKEFSDRIYTMIRMLKAQFSGDYREFPWRSLVMIVGALIYFVTPLDFIPDFIPALGLTDDVSIVFWVYRSVQEDIDKYISWEQTIEI